MQRLHLYRISTNRLCSPMIDRYGAIYHHLLIVKFHCNENLTVITWKKMLSETKQTI